MAIKDIIGPGFVGTDTVEWIVTRGFASSSVVVGLPSVLTEFELKRPKTIYAMKTQDTDFALKRPRTTFEME